MSEPTPASPASPGILVVDDDEAFRLRLVRAFRDRGHKAEPAGDYESALTVAAAFKPGRAVVDLRMPDKSGLEVVRELTERLPGIRCLVLTGYGSIATATEAIRLGALDYLTKPADADQILGAFEQRQGEESAAPPPIEAPSLERVEWEHIQRVLADTGGNVSQAARVLGIHRRSLQRKLARRPPHK